MNGTKLLPWKMFKNKLAVTPACPLMFIQNDFLVSDLKINFVVQQNLSKIRCQFGLIDLGYLSTHSFFCLHEYSFLKCWYFGFYF
jgi:hypothetical protein